MRRVVFVLIVAAALHAGAHRREGVKASQIICEYPAPPFGCRYVPGPDYDPTTGCGLRLQCDRAPEDVPALSATALAALAVALAAAAVFALSRSR